MKLIIRRNRTDTEVWELVDTSIERCTVLVGMIPADLFQGTQLDSDIEHAIEQQGFAEIESIKIREIK